MPPEEEEERRLEVVYPAEFSRTMAGQMAEMARRMTEMQAQIIESMGISAEVLNREFETLRSIMPPRFPNPYFAGSRENSQESSVDPELLNRVRGVIPAMQHDLRPATGLCGRCNAVAIARCYTIGCQHQGVKLCAKHLHENHDGRTLPEGVPHD